MTSHRINEHTSKEEADKMEKFIYNICQKSFITKQLLQKHLYSGNCAVGEKNYECTDCKPSKWVKTPESLERHRKQYHIGEIPLLKCPYENCGQNCVNSNSLRKHIEWHKDIEKKEKERAEFLKRQKQHNEELKRLAKKGSTERVSKSSPSKIKPGEVLSQDIPPFKKGKGRGKSSNK